MKIKAFFTLLCLLTIKHLSGAVFITVKDGSWNDTAIWDKATLPSSTDSIIIRHMVALSKDVNIDLNGALIIESTGIIYGCYDLIFCSAWLYNEGSIMADEILLYGSGGINHGCIHLKTRGYLTGATKPGCSMVFNSFFSDGEMKVNDTLNCTGPPKCSPALPPSIPPSVPHDSSTAYSLNIKCFPNPFISSFTLEYTLPEKGVMNIYVYNGAGKIVYLLQEVKESGLQKEKIELIGRFPGLYFVKINWNDYSVSEKIIKIL